MQDLKDREFSIQPPLCTCPSLCTCQSKLCVFTLRALTKNVQAQGRGESGKMGTNLGIGREGFKQLGRSGFQNCKARHFCCRVFWNCNLAISGPTSRVLPDFMCFYVFPIFKNCPFYVFWEIFSRNYVCFMSVADHCKEAIHKGYK